MRTSYKIFLCVATLVSSPLMAAEHAHHADMASEHGGGIFHMFHLEMEAGSTSEGTPLQGWDFDGWIGTDENKLWLKSEGERADDDLESTEFWALYSRNVSTFWDAQAGLRVDSEPETTAYATLGVNGLAPYWFETEAHIFLSDEGDVTARLRQENDFLITQKLVLQPYLEVNLAAQDVHDQALGSGISDGQIGLQTRYELTRKFAPYVDVHYGQKFGETSSLAKDEGEANDEWVGAIGLRLMF